ncbi:MAG TPA: hypothetical protein VF941_21170 [Clostridia bacterium]
MLIVIEEVNKTNQEYEILFNSAYGSAHAYWDGDEPQVGKQYNVEFGFPEGLRFGVEVVESQENKLSVFEVDRKMAFCALLEDVEEDGFTSFRMDNSLLVADVEGKPLPNNIFVNVIPEKIVFYDQHYY